METQDDGAIRRKNKICESQLKTASKEIERWGEKKKTKSQTDERRNVGKSVKMMVKLRGDDENDDRELRKKARSIIRTLQNPLAAKKGGKMLTKAVQVKTRHRLWGLEMNGSGFPSSPITACIGKSSGRLEGKIRNS